MPTDDALRRALANLRHNADAYRREAERMAADDEAGAGVGSDEVVTVTVDGSGRLRSVEFTGAETSPAHWRAGWSRAYEEALRRRRPTPARPLVPAVVTSPPPRPGPLAAEQQAAERRIARVVADSAVLADRLPDLQRTGESGGVSVTVSGMRLVIGVMATPAALDQEPARVDHHFMTAYAKAMAALDSDELALTGGDR